MQDIDEIIDEARDAREVKRAVSGKMGGKGLVLSRFAKCSTFRCKM